MIKYNFLEFLGRYIDAPSEAPLIKMLPKLPVVAKEGPWIAGGAIRRTLQQSPIESDIDFFFATQEQESTFFNQVKELGGWQISAKEHVTTYGLKYEHTTVILQAVKMAYYPSLEACLDSFDFTITQFGFDGETLVCGEFSLWDLARKRLALHKLTYGVSTVRRLIKYTRQGFTACGGVLASILEQTIVAPETVNRNVTYVD